MEGDVRTLERRLHALKRRGANLLLVDAPTVEAGCARLLGSDDEDRRRLFVLGDGAGGSPEERADKWGRDPERVGVVEVPSTGTRSTATSRPVGDGGPSGPGDAGPNGPGDAGPNGPEDDPGTVEPVGPATGDASAPVPWARESDEPWYSRTAPGDLSAAARHAHVHLSRFEAADPEPGEVRLCLDPLDGIVAEADLPAVHRFLEVVTNRVRMSRGIGHYHVSAAAEGLVEELEPQFDATVETSSIDGSPHQRWTLHSEDVRTDWLPL